MITDETTVLIMNRIAALERALVRVITRDVIDTSATGAWYLGDPGTDGSWRITRSGTDLVIHRRESAVWTTKQTVAA